MHSSSRSTFPSTPGVDDGPNSVEGRRDLLSPSHVLCVPQFLLEAAPIAVAQRVRLGVGFSWPPAEIQVEAALGQLKRELHGDRAQGVLGGCPLPHEALVGLAVRADRDADSRGDRCELGPVWAKVARLFGPGVQGGRSTWRR